MYIDTRRFVERISRKLCWNFMAVLLHVYFTSLFC